MSKPTKFNATHEERKERYEFQQAIEERDEKLKHANRLLGDRGAEIYKLRCQLAEAFALHSKYERGEWRRLEGTVMEQLELLQALAEDNRELRKENGELREKLAASEHVEVDDDTDD